MTKTLSQIITTETKAEDLFDLLKSGFSVDVKGMSIIDKINNNQIDRQKNRIIKEIQYNHDYSVFYALVFSYPMNNLSQNMEYFKINELYETFSKAIINSQITNLKKFIGFIPGSNGTEEKMKELEPKYKNYINKLKKLQKDIFEQKSYNQWIDILSKNNKKYFEEMRSTYDSYSKSNKHMAEKFRSIFYHALGVTGQYVNEVFDKKSFDEKQFYSITLMT